MSSLRLIEFQCLGCLKTKHVEIDNITGRWADVVPKGWGVSASNNFYCEECYNPRPAAAT